MALPIAAAAGAAARTATQTVATVVKATAQATGRVVATTGKGAARAAQSGAKGFSTTVARGKVAAGRTMARPARQALFRQAASSMSRSTDRSTFVQRRLPRRSPSRGTQDRGRLRMLGILAQQGKRAFDPRGRSSQALASRPSVRAAINDMPSPRLRQFSRAADQSRTEKSATPTDDLQKLVQEALSQRGEKATYITVNNGGTVNNGPNEARPKETGSNEARKPNKAQRPPRAKADLTRSMIQVLRQISPHDR